MSTSYDSFRERFWSHVDKAGDCWIWTLRPDAQGYGQLNLGKRDGKQNIIRAHRLSYLLNVGEIPDGLVVMHICDNRICVRPEHLKLGTTAENIDDARRKGRWHNHPSKERELVGRKGPRPRDVGERFWAKVAKRGETECWEWQGSRSRKNYGLFFMPGRGRNGGKDYAHRVAYVLSTGPIADGEIIMHICDNPPCCNPSHLVAGTRVDNNLDRDGKGRAGWLSGEASPSAKLTESDVIEIRRLAAEGVSQFILADQFGVQQPQISRIVRRKSWRYLP